MSQKDLERMLNQISDTEKKIAEKQVQIDRLKELVDKQKKIIDDLNKSLQENKGKMEKMYDMPADVEALKRLVGTQRAEINDKDSKLEIAYGRIAELETELKGYRQTQNAFGKQFEDVFAQITAVKTELVEKTALINFKETEIKNLNVKIEEFVKLNNEQQKQIQVLQEQLRTKEMSLLEEKNKIQAELKSSLLDEKGEAFKQVKELESKIFEKEMAVNEAVNKAKQTELAYNELKVKYEQSIKKNNEAQEDLLKKLSEVPAMQKELEALRLFKHENQATAIVFNKLRKLFEKEPMYQLLFIVWDIGIAPVSDLKNAVAVPSITIQKYIQAYVDAGIFKITEDGKVTLVDRPQK